MYKILSKITAIYEIILALLLDLIYSQLFLVRGIFKLGLDPLLHANIHFKTNSHLNGHWNLGLGCTLSWLDYHFQMYSFQLRM